MGRFTRVVAVDVPHHVTQRGNGRRFVLDGDADRTIYLKLLRENIVLYGVALIGYCLMSNHIHLIAIPHKVDGLEHFPFYCRPSRASLNHAWALPGVMDGKALVMAWSSASLLRALTARSSCLSLAQAFSMGFRSGE